MQTKRLHCSHCRATVKAEIIDTGPQRDRGKFECPRCGDILPDEKKSRTSLFFTLGAIVIIFLGIGAVASIINRDSKNDPHIVNVNQPANLAAVPNQPPTEQKWYAGGTLHEKGILEWQVGNAADKLATCGDFVAAMWQKKNFVPRIQNSTFTPEDLKPYAQELANYIDEATKKFDDPATNRKMFANEKVKSIATIGMMHMRWLKTD